MDVVCDSLLLLVLDESHLVLAASRHLALLALFTLVVGDTLVTLGSADIFTMTMHPASVTHIGTRSTFLAWIFGGIGGGFGIFMRFITTVNESIGAAAESRQLALLALFTLVVGDTLVTLRSADVFTMTMHPALVTHIGARSTFLAWIVWIFGWVDSDGWTGGHEQQCKQLHDQLHHCVQMFVPAGGE